MVPPHVQRVTRSYMIAYPEHPPRKSDPHYIDFEHYRAKTKNTARCTLADTGECKGGLELHHHLIEFALQNGVDFAALEKDFPGISDPSQVGAWVESDQNLEWLCEWHHRGHAGAHVAAHADYLAQEYVRGLIQ